MGKFKKEGRFSGKKRFGNDRDSRGGERPERTMHRAVCSQCHKDCEVPFRPTGDKPVFCSDCFSKKEDSGNSRFERRDSARFDRSDRPDFEMHQAVCDECHKTCEVPFKPSSGKPIFCADCFSEKGNRRINSVGADQYKKQFEMLNNKLDNILKILSPKTAEAVVKEVKKVEKIVEKKEIAKKVVAPKKVATPKKEAKKKATKKKK